MSEDRVNKKDLDNEDHPDFVILWGGSIMDKEEVNKRNGGYKDEGMGNEPIELTTYESFIVFGVLIVITGLLWILDSIGWV